MDTYILIRRDGFFVAVDSRTGPAYTQDLTLAKHFTRDAAERDRRPGEVVVRLQDHLERITA